MRRSESAVWCQVDVCHHASSLRVKVMDREHIGAETVGSIFISTDDIMSCEPVEGWWDLVVSNSGDIQVSNQTHTCGIRTITPNNYRDKCI